MFHNERVQMKQYRFIGTYFRGSNIQTVPGELTVAQPQTLLGQRSPYGGYVPLCDHCLEVVSSISLENRKTVSFLFLWVVGSVLRPK